MLFRSVKSAPVATTQRTATLASPVAPHTQVSGIRFGPQRDHPADFIRQTAPVIQGGTGYNTAATTYNIATTTRRPARVKSVRGFSLFSRRANRLAIRNGPQAVHPADVIRGYASTNGIAVRAVLILFTSTQFTQLSLPQM